MKHHNYLSMAVIAAVTFSIGMAEALAATDRVTPIKFARGATSAIVKGKLSGFKEEQQYSIVVKKGQTLKIEQVNPANKRTTIWLTDPKGSDASDADLSCNNKKQVAPTIAGTYLIKVSECMKADPWKGSYQLKITVK